MRLLLAPLVALATCGAPTTSAPAELPPCPGMIVEQTDPMTCDIAPPQTLIQVGGEYPCELLGGTLYVSTWPDRPALCIDIDY